MRKLMIALAMGAAFLLPLDGYTLGLGEIEVKSALNQELEAEIELLSAVPEDAEALIVKLASREEFNRAGLDRPFLLQDLKFSNVIKNGVPHVKITSSKPIREPFLNFLIEVDWPKGHLLREYTILLDPPIFINEEASARPAPSGPRPTAPAPVKKGATSSGAGMSVVAPVSSMSANSQAPAATTQAGRATPTTQTSAAPGPTYATPNRDPDYRVKQGDTAWSLADELRPDQSVSIEQMMLALLRTNPESFIKDNVNGLKRGFILRVPERSEITSLSQADAVAMVRQQNALWREYQQVAGSGSSASNITKSGADKSAASKAKAGDARLSIVSAGKGAATGAVGNLDAMSTEDLRAQLALAEERLESERLENENLQGEVTDLEQQVSKMKRLLSIEDESLAQMQATASKSKTTEQPVKPFGTQKAVTTPDEAADATVPPVVASTDAETELTPGATDTDIAETKDLALDEGEQVFVEDDTEIAAETADQELPVEQTSASDDSLALDNEAPAEQPHGLLVSLLGSPEMLAAAGAGLLLLMGLVYMLIKRRRASTTEASDSADFMDDDLADVADMLDDNALDQTASDEDVAASMAAAEDAAEDFDSDATMILPSAGDTVITEANDEEARDDVVAEADVYLAYGIYQQAEELLQNAIKENPDNDAYRMKLAETYFAGKNATGFEALATEMHKRTQGKGGRWQKLAAMGKDLLPGNDLFKGAGAAGVALDDLVPSPEPMDFDLGLDDDTSASTDTDMDFSLDDDALELPDTAQAASKAAADDELEFDLSETDAVKAEEDFSLDFAAAELDLANEETKPEADAAMDFDLGLGGDTAADTTEAASEDDEIDFDIDVSEELEASATVESAGDADSDDGVVDLSDLDDVDEVSTKLDLARAYLDMGDNEGTRSILEEVIEEGNAAQKSEAEALLAEIAG